MHLREDGKWYEGVHPSLAAQSAKHGGGAPGNWRNRLAAIPVLRNRLARCVLGAGVIALLAWWVVAALHTPPDNLPTALRPRANMAAQAVFKGDEQEFLRFVDVATTDDAGLWYGAVQAQLNRAVGQYQVVTVEVLFENRTDGVAATICRFKSTSRGDLDYAIYWRPDAAGSWKVDGTRTRREM